VKQRNEEPCVIASLCKDYRTLLSEMVRGGDKEKQIGGRQYRGRGEGLHRQVENDGEVEMLAKLTVMPKVRVLCAALPLLFLGACCSAPIEGTVLVRGHSIGSKDRTLKVPNRCDLLAIVQRVREAGGLDEGLRAITVFSPVNGHWVERRLDLRTMTLGEAVSMFFQDGTVIYVPDPPYADGGVQGLRLQSAAAPPSQ
jgi:hypothetical protein